MGKNVLSTENICSCVLDGQLVGLLLSTAEMLQETKDRLPQTASFPVFHSHCFVLPKWEEYGGCADKLGKRRKGKREWQRNGSRRVS